MSLPHNEILARLNEFFAWKYCSLADYVARSGPYIEDGQEALLDLIREIGAEDTALADRLVDVIQEQEGVPVTTPYPPVVSELNYLDLDFQADYLVAELQKQLERGTHLAVGLDDHPQAGEVVRDIQTHTRRRIEQLKRARVPHA